MNFVFISPQFPKTYWNFCDRLKQRGVNVIGVGDTPYEQLDDCVKRSLNEYFKVDDMKDYEEMLRCFGLITFKHGKIDWIESNNEFWLQQDARLRTDFHVTTGIQSEDVVEIKSKSAMKKHYAQAGVPTARYHMVSTLEAGYSFIDEVGYPVIVKPDIGVGAEATFKLKNDKDMRDFYANLPAIPYIMEEFIPGMIISYDGITDSRKEILFETSHVFPTPIMDIVNTRDHLSYYSMIEIDEDIRDAGRRVVEAFSTQSRFFHLEFFRLTKDKAGLGKKGDLVGLEVNMRPPGGYTPDMMNFANETDVYRIWADMVCFDELRIPKIQRQYSCVFASRRDGKRYLYSHEDILKKYGNHIVMEERMPDILSAAMGNQMYTARFTTQKEVDCFIRYVQRSDHGGNE